MLAKTKNKAAQLEQISMSKDRHASKDHLSLLINQNHFRRCTDTSIQTQINIAMLLVNSQHLVSSILTNGADENIAEINPFISVLWSWNDSLMKQYCKYSIDALFHPSINKNFYSHAALFNMCSSILPLLTEALKAFIQYSDLLTPV